jgi:chromosomal replication initiation ATPase DnaA
MADFDPRLTFDSFVVGPANRLASAAARRAADSPGRSYNPLFIYSASGLGKTHILAAVAHQATRANGERKVLYLAVESYLEELAEALRTGTQDALRERYRGLDVLLLDDVQFLAGQPQAQEMLLSTLDALTAAGDQVVLASDRAPGEINGLDARLLSRFSGGLIVDIASPDYETRVAIIRRKSEEGGQKLQPGVAETIAKHAFGSVRELAGALNRVLAIQDLEERPVTAAEAARLMGDEPPEEIGDDFGTFVEEITVDLATAMETEEEPWRKSLRQAAAAAEREGFVARRVRALLERPQAPPDWEQLLASFKAELARLREIEAELDRLGNPWPDAAQAAIRDPERLEEAEALLTSVRERQRPFGKVNPGPALGDLGYTVPQLALKATEALVRDEKPKYNPLFVWSSPVAGANALCAAAARTYAEVAPEGRVAVISVADFAEDFIRALSSGVAGAWRERWWTVDFLLVHGVETLADTERAQDEFFHLFEALKRRGSRMLLAADRPPSSMGGIDQRLRSRFEGGLVLQITAEGLPPLADDLSLQAPTDTPKKVPESDWQKPDTRGSVSAPRHSTGAAPATPPAAPAQHSRGQAKPAAPPPPAPAPPPAAAAATAPAPTAARTPPGATPPRTEAGWVPSHEKVVWSWPRPGDRITEELE